MVAVAGLLLLRPDLRRARHPPPKNYDIPMEDGGSNLERLEATYEHGGEVATATATTRMRLHRSFLSLSFLVFGRPWGGPD